MKKPFVVGDRIALRGTIILVTGNIVYIVFDKSGGNMARACLYKEHLSKAHRLVPKKKHDHARCYDHQDYLLMKEKHDALERSNTTQAALIKGLTERAERSEKRLAEIRYHFNAFVRLPKSTSKKCKFLDLNRAINGTALRPEGQ